MNNRLRMMGLATAVVAMLVLDVAGAGAGVAYSSTEAGSAMVIGLDVEDGQAGGTHRRTRRRTRRRTAVVVHSVDQANDAAQQQAAYNQGAADQAAANQAATDQAAANQAAADANQAAADANQAAAAANQAAAAANQAAAGPPAAAGGALPIGTVVPALPEGCLTEAVGDVQYFHCGADYYRAAFEENHLVYVTTVPGT